MAIRVDSEIGRLRRVLVHRPGREIDRMVPSRMGQLLFDDILDGDETRFEHDLFRQVLEKVGAEVLDAGRLLGEVMRMEKPRRRLLDELEEEYGVLRETVARLEEMEPEELAAALVEGLRPEPEEGPPGPRPAFFDLQPLPNYFFQRDPQVVLGNRVVVSSMATDARSREPLLARMLFDYHPALQDYAALFEIEVPPTGAPRHNPHFPYPTLEGGDVVVVDREIVLIGISERTNRRGVEVLAEYLRLEETPFRHLILVELPAQRSYMHLDTVFTLIDRNTCLAYVPVVEPGGAESAHVYYVDLYAPELTFALRQSLLGTLSALGVDLEVVPCGGSVEVVDQQREQWTDGANAFAVAPGVILLYRRNRKTVEELARRGWRVLTERDVLAASEPLLDGGPAVVTLLSNELSRARGGARCMTMPVERDPV
ncbi:MAG TPA: arginine deiminase family protein [Thermoanaerobaculia bacterium]|nr:arginine deiminase family protein [Thermoanaerobaculia bacterium]